jgi:hypothetical protein
MALSFRSDAYYARTTDGAYILSHEGGSAFTGRSVYQVIDRLVPLLDGRHSLAELTADLGADRREMVRDLVMKLVERGVVRQVGPEGADGPPASPAGSRHDLAFTAYFHDSPVAALNEYRDKVTVLVGAGRLGDAVAAAARRSGIRRVRVVTAAEDPVDSADEVRSLLDGADLVLHACDRPMVKRASMLDRLCAKAGVPLAQILVVGDHAWMASARVDGRGGANWTSGWRRLLARQSAAIGVSAGEPAPNDVPDEAAITAVAGQFVHAAFRSVAGLVEPGQHQLTSVDLGSLRTRVCDFLPHPFEQPAPAPADPTRRIAELRARTRLDEADFSRNAFRCTGDQLGVFSSPAERDFAQVPLHVCETEVADPVGLLSAGAPLPRVTGVGLDLPTARYRAALKALATSASLMIDPRRLIGADDRPLDRGADPDEALSALRSGRWTGLMPGYGLADGRTHHVDVTRVFAALRDPALPYRPPPGVAAGYDWDEALVAAVLDQCRRLTVNNLMTSTTPFPRIDTVGAALDSRGDRYRTLLAAIGEPVTVYDITGPLGVPTMVGYLGSAPAGCASSRSSAGALTEVLEQVLLSFQSREADQPAYAPPPVRDVPEHLRGTITRPLSAEAHLDGTDLAATLAQRGHRPIAVPLDHDPEVSSIMPFIVRVVVADE